MAVTWSFWCSWKTFKSLLSNFDDLLPSSTAVISKTLDHKMFVIIANIHNYLLKLLIARFLLYLWALFSWARCWSTGRECKTMDYWHFSHVWCAISHQKGCATLICMCFLSLIQSDNMVAHTNSSIWLNYVSILNHLDYCCIIRYLFINSSVNYRLHESLYILIIVLLRCL